MIVSSLTDTSSTESTLKSATGELLKSGDFILESLRETRRAIQFLQQREKEQKASMEELFGSGDLDHLKDANDQNKVIGEGITATLCQGKVKREWSPEVQAKLDSLQEQIKDVELRAESARQYTEERGSEYWMIRLEKEL